MSTFEWKFKVTGAQDAEKMAGILDRLNDSLSFFTRRGDAAGRAASQFGSSAGTGAASLSKMGVAAGAGAGAIALLTGLMKSAWAALGKLSDLAGRAAERLRTMGAEASVSRAALTAFFGVNSSVSKSVETLGRTTEYTQKELTDFSIALKRAGTEGDNVAKIMPAAIEASRASGESITSLGKTAAIAMKQFSASSETATDHLLNLTAAGNASATGAGELKQALSNAATSANMLGMSGKTTLTMLAQMADAGIAGSKAGRFLRIAFERLSAPTADASAKLRGLGIDLNALNLAEPSEWLQVFSRRMSGMKGTERIAALKPIFGAASSAMAVLIEKSDGFDAMADKIAGARAEIEEFSRLKGESLNAAIAGWDSALEGFWKTGSKITNVLFKRLYDAGSNALNKITDSIDSVSAGFSAAGNDLESWIDTMQGGGLDALFAGIAEAIAPEIEQVKRLAEAAFMGLSKLFDAAMSNIDWAALAEQVGGALFRGGKALAKGMWAGTKDVAGGTAQKADEWLDLKLPEPLLAAKEFAKGSIQSGQNVGRGIASAAGRGMSAVSGWMFGRDDGLGERSRELAEGPPPPPPPEATDDDRRRRNAEILAASDAMPAPPPPAPGLLPPDTGGGVPEEADLDDLKAKKEALSLQHEINAAQAAYREKVDESNTLIGRTKLALNGIKEGVEEWLVRPFDAFQQKLNDVKEKFGSLMDGLKDKKIDLTEKFGLQTPEQAAKARADVTKKANERDKKLLEATEDPAKKAEIQERMADRLAKQAETAEGPEQQRLAKEAATLLTGAEESTGEAQEDELKRVEIKKDYAKENVAEYEQMLETTDSAGGKAAILESLQGMYQSLGDREKATANVGALEEAKMQEALEKAELAKEQVELLRASLAVQERIAAAAERQNEGGMMPEDPAYAAY